MFLRNCWYVAALDRELIDGRLLRRKILGDNIVMYRGESGLVVALADRCCHRGAPLSMGRLEGDCLRCMYHGLKFDPTGKCIQIPGQDLLPPRMKVRSYPILARDQFVWIWMGDPKLADPGLIVDFPPLRDPAWKGIPAYLHYDANYLLIVDNLSDLSHLAFVHTHTLGGSEEYAYVSKPLALERLERGFRIERWHRDADAPPYHRRVIPNKADKVDRRNRVEMRIPGVFLMETMFSPAGSGATAGLENGVRQYRNCQFMTPESERTTHFFWSYLNDFEGADQTISHSLLAALIEGFMEDKALIEAQQRELDDDPQLEMLAIHADAPLVHFRRTLEKLIEAERAHDERAA